MGPSRGSPRVQAWIYGVINPLLDALAVERHLLEAGNLTWQLHSQGFERIGAPSAYLETEGRINLSDLLRSLRREPPPVEGYGQLHERFDQHDERIGKLSRAAATYHHSLVNDDRFAQLVDRAVQEYLEEKPSFPDAYFISQPWGAYPPEKLKELAAENLVNHIHTPRSNRADAAFWRFFLQRYGVEVPKLGAPCVMAAALEQEARLATEEAKELIEQLEQLRSDLSDAYDLPAAPAPILVHGGAVETEPERLRRGIVSLSGERVGVIEETESGSRFSYDADYLLRSDARPISPTLPLRATPYESTKLHPFFANLLPEGGQLELICQKLKIDPGDRFGVMLATCMDTTGAVEVRADSSRSSP